MNFNYSENQKMIAEMIRSFGEKEITPNSRKWDEDQFFPQDLFKKLGELGLMGCLLYTSPSPRDATLSRMPSSA